MKIHLGADATMVRVLKWLDELLDITLAPLDDYFSTKAGMPAVSALMRRISFKRHLSTCPHVVFRTRP